MLVASRQNSEFMLVPHHFMVPLKFSWLSWQVVWTCCGNVLSILLHTFFLASCYPWTQEDRGCSAWDMRWKIPRAPGIKAWRTGGEYGSLYARLGSSCDMRELWHVRQIVIKKVYCTSSLRGRQREFERERDFVRILPREVLLVSCLNSCCWLFVAEVNATKPSAQCRFSRKVCCVRAVLNLLLKICCIERLLAKGTTKPSRLPSWKKKWRQDHVVRSRLREKTEEGIFGH